MTGSLSATMTGCTRRSAGTQGPTRMAVLAAALLAVVLAGRPAWAVVTSDDPDSAHHLVQPDSQYNMVGYLDLLGGTTGVLIGPRHVLTAKHVAWSVSDPTTITFYLDLPDGRHEYGVSERRVHPEADIALLILSEHTQLTGYALYRGSDEAGRTGAIVGYGKAGTGTTGGYLPAGTKRIAWNRIDVSYYPNPAYDDILGYDFDQFDGDDDGPWDGDSLGEMLEGLVSTGDSGGGLFIEVDGVPQLAGIHSQVVSSGGGEVIGFYGECALEVRISELADWINGQVPGDANGDGRIDGSDYTIWSDHYGQTGVDPWSAGGWAVGNFNEDNVINGADYTVWADNYLYGTGLPAGTPIPEPAVAVLVILGGIAALRRRR